MVLSTKNTMESSRIWGSMNTKNGLVEIRTITNKDMKTALDVLDQSFFINENVCNGCEINLSENVQARLELRELCRLTANDGISLAAFDVKSGQAVSVAFNKIQYIPKDGEEHFFIKFRNECANSPQAQSLMDFMINVDSETDVFKMYDLDSVCELMFLATLPAWEQLGLGRTLTDYTIKLTRELSEGIGIKEIHPTLRLYRPQAVTAIFTSRFSQKIGRLLGFRVLNSLSYTKYHFNGKSFASRINPYHKYCEHVIYTF